MATLNILSGSQLDGAGISSRFHNGSSLGGQKTKELCHWICVTFQRKGRYSLQAHVHYDQQQTDLSHVVQ